LARPFDQLKLRRTAKLIICQRGRERRRRIDVLKAEQARNAAAAAEKSAREDRDTQLALCAVSLTESYEAVRNRVIDLHELKLLMGVEKDLQRRARAAEMALDQAQDHCRKAESALADATCLLGTEVKLTRRRERLADKVRAAWQQATEATIEAEVEDQSTDSWNAA
jgi:hypothetical protein